jgi:transaldolase
MKIFLDTADVVAIKKWSETGIIDGVTTNPSHLAKQSGDPLTIIKQICQILPESDISVQVTEQDPAAVYRQAVSISQIADNITVKIPCSQDYYPIIKRLVEEDIPINITLVFSLTQGLAMAKLGVAYISPFIGRLEDAGEDGIGLVEGLCDMMDVYQFSTEVLAASVRSVAHIEGAIEAGAHAVTMSPELLEKAIQHPLTDKGMKVFQDDWAKVVDKTFPGGR